MSLVAVSQRVEFFSDLNETRDALDQRLVAFLLQAGLLPIPVPNTLCSMARDGRRDAGILEDWLAKLGPRALVLSGGNDIGQCLERDATEGYLLDYANRFQLPALGICRGMQMMASWVGMGVRAAPGHVRTRHFLSGHIVGEANSYHSYSLADCPAGFEVLARSGDGEIEAIRHSTLRWEGWMWHPEREEPFSFRDAQRARALLCT